MFSLSVVEVAKLVEKFENKNIFMVKIVKMGKILENPAFFPLFYTIIRHDFLSTAFKNAPPFNKNNNTLNISYIKER